MNLRESEGRRAANLAHQNTKEQLQLFQLRHKLLFVEQCRGVQLVHFVNPCDQSARTHTRPQTPHTIVVQRLHPKPFTWQARENSACEVITARFVTVLFRAISPHELNINNSVITKPVVRVCARIMVEMGSPYKMGYNSSVRTLTSHVSVLPPPP